MNLKNSKRTYSPKAPKQSTLENMFPKSNESTMKVLDDKIVDFLADSGVAFRTIGLQSFKDVIASVNNKVEVKSRVFYSKLVEQKADEIRDEKTLNALCLAAMMIEQLGLDNPQLHLFRINDNASNMKLAIKSSS